MNIYAKAGDKVIFLDENGMQSERENAVSHGMVKGEVYEVLETKVYGGYTSVRLKGFPGRYNSVLFDDFKENE